MSEPTVTIPTRLALQAARHLNSLSALLRNDSREKVQAIVMHLVDAITDQSSMEDIKTAAVSAKLEDSA